MAQTTDAVVPPIDTRAKKVERHSRSPRAIRAARACGPSRRAWPCSRKRRELPLPPEGASWPTSPRACSSPTWATIRRGGGSGSSTTWDQPRCGDAEHYLPAAAADGLQRRDRDRSRKPPSGSSNYAASSRAASRCEQVMLGRQRQRGRAKGPLGRCSTPARQDIILATRFGFHGKKGLAGAVTGSEQDKDRDPRVRFIDFPREGVRQPRAAEQPLDLEKYRQELDGLWKQFGDRICCLITEPYLGGGGSYPSAKGIPPTARAVLPRARHVFIFDEVQANFGRTGQLFAFTTLRHRARHRRARQGPGQRRRGGAAVGRADLFANMHYGEASDTWSGNPLSAPRCSPRSTSTPRRRTGKRRGARVGDGLLRLTELAPVRDSRRGDRVGD